MLLFCKFSLFLNYVKRLIQINSRTSDSGKHLLLERRRALKSLFIFPKITSFLPSVRNPVYQNRKNRVADTSSIMRHQCSNDACLWKSTPHEPDEDEASWIASRLAELGLEWGLCRMFARRNIKYFFGIISTRPTPHSTARRLLLHSTGIFHGFMHAAEPYRTQARKVDTVHLRQMMA